MFEQAFESKRDKEWHVTVPAQELNALKVALQDQQTIIEDGHVCLEGFWLA